MEQSLAHLASATSNGAREEMDDLRSVQAQLSAMLDRLVDLIESGQERAEDIGVHSNPCALFRLGTT